jgi:hypothetical protein
VDYLQLFIIVSIILHILNNVIIRISTFVLFQIIQPPDTKKIPSKSQQPILHCRHLHPTMTYSSTLLQEFDYEIDGFLKAAMQFLYRD